MSPRRNNEGPLSLRQLQDLKPRQPETKPPDLMQVTLQTVSLPEPDRLSIRRDWKGEHSRQLVAEIDGHQIERLGHDLFQTVPFERVPETRLHEKWVHDQAENEILDGKYPSYSWLAYLPEVSQIDAELVERFRERRRGEDEPTNVFGTDERYIYNDTRFPWRTVGRIWTSTGACAGCTIGPRLVLTASHCINWLSGGGIGWVKFSPAYYNGNGPWGEYYATRVIYWNKATGGLSDQETAFDYVVLVMDDYVGNHVGYPGYRTYNDSWNGDDVWQHMGYPGDLTSTQRPAFQGDCTVSSTSSESLSGQTGYVMGHYNDITGGHSGGPVWGWWSGEDWPRVVGVQSAEASVPAYNTSGDNEFGGGPALSSLITWARNNYP